MESDRKFDKISSIIEGDTAGSVSVRSGSLFMNSHK